jgi:hypothetical protein
VADERADRFLERAADVASVSGKDEHQSERGHGQSGAEGAELHDRAPAEHQRADDDERRREQVRGVAKEGPEPVGHRRADAPALPAEIDQRGEEEPDGGQAQADQLGMVVAALLRRALAPLHACGRARSEHTLLALARHARLLLRRCRDS